METANEVLERMNERDPRKCLTKNPSEGRHAQKALHTRIVPPHDGGHVVPVYPYARKYFESPPSEPATRRTMAMSDGKRALDKIL